MKASVIGSGRRRELITYHTSLTKEIFRHSFEFRDDVFSNEYHDFPHLTRIGMDHHRARDLRREGCKEGKADRMREQKMNND